MDELRIASEAARKLSDCLEKMEDNNKFSVDTQLLLERMSWEIYRKSNDLKEIFDLG